MKAETELIGGQPAPGAKPSVPDLEAQVAAIVKIQLPVCNGSSRKPSD
jgi:hypothetical protein